MQCVFVAFCLLSCEVKSIEKIYTVALSHRKAQPWVRFIFNSYQHPLKMLLHISISHSNQIKVTPVSFLLPISLLFFCLSKSSLTSESFVFHYYFILSRQQRRNPHSLQSCFFFSKLQPKIMTHHTFTTSTLSGILDVFS